MLHRRALAALAQPVIGAPDVVRLAHHAEAAGDTSAVLRYAPPAAVQAAAVGAHREALHQYGRALRFAAGLAADQRAQLLERFADEGYLTDMREEAVVALDEALAIHRDAGEPLKAGNVQRLRARHEGCMGRSAEAVADAREAIRDLEQLPPGIELARAYEVMSQQAMLTGNAGETIVWGQKAIALAGRIDDTEALAGALNNIGVIELSRGNLAGKAKLERSLDLARDGNLVEDAGRAYNNLCCSLGELGRHLDITPYATEGFAYCQEHGLDVHARCLLAVIAENQLARGPWDQAAETATSLIDAPPSWAIGPIFDASRVRALVRARRGDPDHQTPLGRAEAIAESVGDLGFIAPVAAAKSECA